MKYLKYLLFLFIVFITPNVFAYDYDVTNSITAPSGPATGGRYLGLEISNSGLQNNYSVNTRYNGTLSEIVYNLPLPANAGQCFTTNMYYTITMEMATSDWRNHFATPFIADGSTGTNWNSGNVVFVSMKKIYFKFKIPSTATTCYDFVYVRLRSPSVSNTAFTGTSNWNLSKITLSDSYSSSGGSGSSSGGSSGTGSSINNNTLSCTNGLTLTSTTYQGSNANITNSYINSSGNLVSNSSYNVINNIPIKPNTNYQIKKTTSTGDVPSYCLSSTTSSYGSCTAYNTRSTLAFNSGNNSYLSFSIRRDETIYLSYCASSIEIDNQNTQNIIDNQNQNTTDIIDNANQNTQNIIDNVTNSNIDNGLGSDFFNNFSSQDFGLSQIITLPLTTIQSLANTSCVSLNIPIPFTNSTIPLPCMTQVYQTYIPTIFSIWQVVSFGIIAYFICIDIVHLVKGFKDPDSDKVEVLDL